MPLQNYRGQTFVAFTDIAGFKAMMNDGDRARAALNALYQAGYAVIGQEQRNANRVEGLFVSDCGILFVRGDGTPAHRLETLLSALELLNRRCFEHAVSLTTSIAWGEFSYHERIEIPGIEKNPVYGNAYVATVLDNGAARPKLYPNECRILKRDLPADAVALCTAREHEIGRRIRDTQNHFYFDWMRTA